jgi:hypothetical protein
MAPRVDFFSNRRLPRKKQKATFVVVGGRPDLRITHGFLRPHRTIPLAPDRVGRIFVASIASTGASGEGQGKKQQETSAHRSPCGYAKHANSSRNVFIGDSSQSLKKGSACKQAEG